MSESFAELFEESLQTVDMEPGSIVTGVVIDNTSGEGDATVVDWGQIWWLPCLGAGAILAVFVLLFREKKQTPAAA